MGLSINTNVGSLNAQRNLGKSQNALSKSMQRLSSGLRINSAKDDAAGLAISDRMTSQIRGINQAVRNANDGISLAQTAEGAMQEVTNLLQRMREIGVQASNDTYSSSDRASLQGEMDQLYQEIDRIGNATEFNGINLLDGSGGTRDFQVGANAGQTVSLELSSIKTNDLNLNGYSALGELNGGRVNAEVAAASSVTLNGVVLTTAPGGASATNKETWINTFTSQTGVTADAYNVYQGLGGGSGISSSLTINGDAISSSGSMEELVSNINRDAAGVTATLSEDGGVTLSNDTGNDIVVGGTVTNTGMTAGTYTGYVSLSSSDGSEISIGVSTQAEFSSTTQADKIDDLQGLGFNISAGSDDMVSGAVGNNKVLAADLITINGERLGASAGTTAADKATTINAISDKTGVRASAYTEATFSHLDFSQNVQRADDVKINGAAVDLTSVTNVDEVVTAINNAGVQGVLAEADDSTGELILKSEAGFDINVELVTGSSSFFGSDVKGSQTTAYFDIDLTHVANFTSANNVQISVNGSTTHVNIDLTAATTMANIVSAFNGATGIAATEEDGKLKITTSTATDSFEIFLSAAAPATVSDVFDNLTNGHSLSFDENGGTMTANETKGNITLSSDSGGDITVGSDLATETAKNTAIAKLGMIGAGGNETAIGSGLSVLSVDNANNAIERIDDALNSVDSIRGVMGATQNRLESSIANLQNVSENLSAARSRILDADIAQETSAMTKNNILQQAGVSILAQANQAPQLALSLLG